MKRLFDFAVTAVAPVVLIRAAASNKIGAGSGSPLFCGLPPI